MNLEFFGFKKNPFQRGISPKDLYRSQQVSEALARLLYVCERRSMAVITGSVGAGKSTLIRLLKSELDPLKFKFIYIADSNLVPKNFLVHSLKGLGVEPPFRLVHAKRLFKEVVLDLYENKGFTCVFAIDEVQSIEHSMLQELLFLTNFYEDSFSPMAFILTGQAEMLTRLKTLAFSPVRRRVETFYSLEGMDEKETKAYIEHHLKKAGISHPIFPDDIQTLIFEHSKGIPASINRLCLNCLLEAASQKKQLIDRDSFNSSLAELF